MERGRWRSEAAARPHPVALAADGGEARAHRKRARGGDRDRASVGNGDAGLPRATKQLIGLVEEWKAHARRKSVRRSTASTSSPAMVDGSFGLEQGSGYDARGETKRG
jgi:hypothetical protein